MTADRTIEQVAISKCIQEEDALTYLIENHVTQDFFVIFPKEAEWIFEYWRKYGKAPRNGSFARQFPHFKLNDNDMDLPYVVDELREHYAYQFLTKEIEQASELVVEGKAVDALIQLRQSLNRAGELAPITDVDIINQYEIAALENLEERIQRFADGQSVGIKTGFPAIDKYGGGWEGGEMVTVFGRMEVGKSWVLLKFAEVAYLQGCNVLYIPLEMSVRKVSYRFHTLVSQAIMPKPIKNENLVKGRGVDLKKYQDLLEFLRLEYPNKFTVTNASTTGGRFTADTLLQKIEKHEPDICFVDYITLLSSSGDKQGWEAIQELSREIKQITMRKNMPIIVAAQESRDGAKLKGKPKLENIAYCDSIGQDSDKVFGLSRLDESTLLISCVKNRDGAQFNLTVDFDVNVGRLAEIDSWKAGGEL